MKRHMSHIVRSSTSRKYRTYCMIFLGDAEKQKITLLRIKENKVYCGTRKIPKMCLHFTKSYRVWCVCLCRGEYPILEIINSNNHIDNYSIKGARFNTTRKFFSSDLPPPACENTFRSLYENSWGSIKMYVCVTNARVTESSALSWH